MLKICGSSIYKPLEMIFKQCIETGVFSSEWKKANIVPIHKKGGKQALENYLPVSSLPVCGKILVRLMFNEMFNFFIENKLISSNQSGFKPGDSRINQLLSITHEIYESFDVRLEVRSVFLDIPKAYDKVWHDLQTKIIYHVKTNLKWNIRKFTKPFGGFFKGKKTLRSPQMTSLYMGKYQCWSTSRFHP